MTENQTKNKRKEFLRVVKFTLVSISAGIIQLGSTALMDLIPGMYEWASYLVGLVLSVLWNFTINRRYTFKSATNVPVAMMKVGLFYLVFTPLSTWVEHIFNTLGWDVMIATIVLMLANFVLEFLYCTFFVYKKSMDTNDIAKREQEKENGINNDGAKE